MIVVKTVKTSTIQIASASDTCRSASFHKSPRDLLLHSVSLLRHSERAPPCFSIWQIGSWISESATIDFDTSIFLGDGLDEQIAESTTGTNALASSAPFPRLHSHWLLQKPSVAPFQIIQRLHLSASKGRAGGRGRGGG